MSTRYDTDVYLWSEEQAALLEARQFDALDLPNILEELRDVGSHRYLAVSSALYQSLVHLLKWQYQPSKWSTSWRTSLIEHRNRIPRQLHRAPSLARELPAMLVREYPAACRKASTQTSLALNTFPSQCPWSVEQVLDPDFVPEACGAEEP